MKVVILCGGLGTRLRQETEFRPKPMVPIGDRPILWHIMKIYAHYGHKDFILCLGYRGEVIKDFFRNYHWHVSDVTLTLGGHPRVRYHSRHEEEDWTVTLLDTGPNTQTGGRLGRALRYLDSGPFLFTYGDGLTNCNINDVIAFHRGNQATATVTAVHPLARFGDLIIKDGSVLGFNEKTQPKTSFINGGFFVLNREVERHLTGDGCIFEQDVLPKLTAEGNLRAFIHRGFWQCMDTYREQQFLDELWRTNQAPWKVWQR